MVKQIWSTVIVNILQLITGIDIDMRCNLIPNPSIRTVLVNTLLYRMLSGRVVQIVEIDKQLVKSNQICLRVWYGILKPKALSKPVSHVSIRKKPLFNARPVLEIEI